ncbi:MAG: peptidase C39 [Clostridia bacterium]|nr:peptidase C39 [Clostridia bacterium]
MKNLLNYQSSEFDCGPTSVTNAIRYLFEREEIAPCLLKHIWVMGNDTFCDEGQIGKHGTSKASMRYMADWMNSFGRGCKFPIAAKFLELEDAVIQPENETWKCLENGGCAVIRCVTGGIPHYVLLTGILSDTEIGVFDPYEEDPEFDEDSACRVIDHQPRVMNRGVQYERFNQVEPLDYAMGERENREVLLIWRNDQMNMK